MFSPVKKTLSISKNKISFPKNDISKSLSKGNMDNILSSPDFSDRMEILVANFLFSNTFQSFSSGDKSSFILYALGRNSNISKKVLPSLIKGEEMKLNIIRKIQDFESFPGQYKDFQRISLYDGRNDKLTVSSISEAHVVQTISEKEIYNKYKFVRPYLTREIAQIQNLHETSVKTFDPDLYIFDKESNKGIIADIFSPMNRFYSQSSYPKNILDFNNSRFDSKDSEMLTTFKKIVFNSFRSKNNNLYKYSQLKDKNIDLKDFFSNFEKEINNCQSLDEMNSLLLKFRFSILNKDIDYPLVFTSARNNSLMFKLEKPHSYALSKLREDSKNISNEILEGIRKDRLRTKEARNLIRILSADSELDDSMLTNKNSEFFQLVLQKSKVLAEMHTYF